MEEEEMAEWKVLQEPTLIGEERNALEYEIPKAKEVMFIFYGRTNDAENSLSNAADNCSIWVNGVRVGVPPFTYVRGEGICYHTVLRIVAQNGYIDGTISPKGGWSIHAFSDILFGDEIETLSVRSNRLFKAESTVAIYYR